MRIIFFAGKGGIGKTSVAAATGIKAAERGQRTVIMSLDVDERIEKLGRKKSKTGRKKMSKAEID
ncbi:MAG: ArsA-related P-loop ATPase [Desulfobacterales bacterium]